jgi:WXG100 family type VII secretion target
MDSITLNVKPEVLTAKAGELNSEKTTIVSIMEQAKTEITSLTGTWKSEASDEYQNRFKQIYDDIDNMLAIVTEYISDLNESANIYSTAEQAAKSAAEGQPTDGVFKV